MHKLVILIEQLDNLQAFENLWPEFLHQVEDMPGLRRETSSRVDHFLFGKQPFLYMHELFFDNLEEAQQAMASLQGRSAGRLLQQMSGSRLSLFFADHKEDDLEHIRKFARREGVESADPEE